MNNYCEDLIKRTEELCGTIRKAKTPAYPGKVLKKRRDNEPIVAVEEYCSLIGTALYMVKKVSPVSINAVRELSQYLAEPTADHWRALMLLIGFFKQKPPVMKIRATKSLRSVGYSDSNYATYEDDRKSISGNTVTLGGSVVSCSGRKQDGTTLSTCEAEYVSKTHCAQEVRYVQQVVGELEKKQKKLRAWIFRDNNGTIFWQTIIMLDAENKTH
jgi:hypothetical protein